MRHKARRGTGVGFHLGGLTPAHVRTATHTPTGLAGARTHKQATRAQISNTLTKQLRPGFRLGLTHHVASSLAHRITSPGMLPGSPTPHVSSITRPPVGERMAQHGALRHVLVLAASASLSSLLRPPPPSPTTKSQEAPVRRSLEQQQAHNARTQGDATQHCQVGAEAQARGHCCRNE